MKIIYIALFTSLVGANALASNCTDQIFFNEEFIGKDYNNDPLPDASIQCLLDDLEFQKGLKVLCIDNQKDISPTYKNYLSYYHVVKEIQEEWAKETDEREKSLLIARMQIAKRNLDIFGITDELSRAKMNLFRAQSRCRDL